MERLCVMGLLLFALVAGSPFAACAGDEPSTEDLRQAMVELVSAIERARGLGTDSAETILAAEDEVIEAFFFGADRKEIVERSRRIVDQIERASATEETPPSDSPETLGYAPDYPGWDEISFETARAYGLVDYPSNRCSGDSYEDWKESMFWYGYSLDQAEPTCVVSGCDPTGIICAIDCGIVSVAMVVYNGLKVGVEACEKHDGNVNGAEIEAAYENSLSDSSGIADLSQDLSSHDARIRSQLSSQHSSMSAMVGQHDALMQARLASLEADLAAMQQTMDDQMEIRQVHVEVLEVLPGQRFLLSTSEAGQPVDVSLIEVRASRLMDDLSGVEFVRVPATGTPIPGAAGMLDVRVTFPSEFRVVPKVVHFRVKDTHAGDRDSPNVEHFGSAMVASRGTSVVIPAGPSQRGAPAKRRFR